MTDVYMLLALTWLVIGYASYLLDVAAQYRTCCKVCPSMKKLSPAWLMDNWKACLYAFGGLISLCIYLYWQIRTWIEELGHDA